MKIRLAILSRDIEYLNRISAVLSSKYTDQIETYSFTKKETALSELAASKIDILIADEEFDVDPDTLPRRCGFAYILDTSDVNILNGQPAISKYQKPDLIYRQILNIFAERASEISGTVAGEGSARIISFSSPAGGAGTSTLAAACALYFSSQGHRCLYLNLEPFGSANLFFSGEGQFDLSDIIFALKSRKTNFQLKLESCVRRSEAGVYFYAPPKVALDILELSDEDIIHLLDTLKISGNYDELVLDAPFDMSERTRNIHRQAHTLVWVSDGSETANCKIQRAYQSLEICEENQDRPMTDRLYLAYNRYSSKTGRRIEEIPVKVLGGARRFENRTTEQIVAELSRLDIFSRLEQE